MNSFTLERNNYRRRLIMLVKQHPILWNKTQENYNRNRPQKILAWHQISEQLHISVDKLRRTWENLRDQYRRDLKREVRLGFKSKWRFFSDMDFIRAMVSCKEHELKETEFTDSDSELDVTDNHQLHTSCSTLSTTQLTPTAIKAITTPCTSSVASSNITCPTNIVPFQPIVLSKQWQTLAENTPAACKNQAKQVPPSTDPLEFVSNCDSSKDYAPSNNADLSLHNIAKAEPELDLEVENTTAAMHTHSQNNKINKEFQEPCVSTSGQKHSRASLEEISETSLATTSRAQIKTETDLNVKDDDYYFVMSLLPSLRQISTKRKFPLRIGIMSLIAKDLEEACKE